MFILRTGLIRPHHYQKTPNSFVSLKGQKKSSRDENINVIFWLGLTPENGWQKQQQPKKKKKLEISEKGGKGGEILSL